MKHKTIHVLTVGVLVIGTFTGAIALGGFSEEANAQPAPPEPGVALEVKWSDEGPHKEYSDEDYYGSKIVVGNEYVYSTADFYNTTSDTWEAYIYKTDGETGKLVEKKLLWTKGGNGWVHRLYFSNGHIYVFQTGDWSSNLAGYAFVYNPDLTLEWEKNLIGDYPVRDPEMYDVDDGYMSLVYYMDSSDPSPIRLYNPNGSLVWETITDQRYSFRQTGRMLNLDMDNRMIAFQNGTSSPEIHAYNISGFELGSVTAATGNTRHYPRITNERKVIIGDDDGSLPQAVGVHLLDPINSTQIAVANNVVSTPTNYYAYPYYITGFGLFNDTIVITTSYSEVAGLDADTLSKKWEVNSTRNEAWAPSQGLGYEGGYLVDVNGKLIHFEPDTGDYVHADLPDSYHLFEGPGTTFYDYEGSTFSNDAPLFKNSTKMAAIATITIPKEKCIGIFCLLDNPLVFIGLAVLGIMVIALAGKSMAIAAWSGYLMFSYLALQSSLNQNLINVVYATLVLMLMGIGFKLWRLEGGGES